MTDERVAIIDGGGANIASLKFALARAGVAAQLTVDPDTIRSASHVILPGVGAARNSMMRLSESRLVGLIPNLEQPVLGICLGMQLFCEGSEENDTRCLGIFPGKARLFAGGAELPVPHMGWNQIQRTRDSDLLDGIPDGSYFYFVHSYALDPQQDTLALSEYGRPFTAIVERDNFAATQFHPERSGESGARLLRNFLRRKAQ
jgi:glutamine amidotransferase